jgi:hypothetical protein
VTVIAVMLAISVMVMIVFISEAVPISVSIPVPVMVMLKPASIPFPITRKKLFAVVMRFYPSSAFIWRQTPIPFVPTVMSANGIPIPTDPHIPRGGT